MRRHGTGRRECPCPDPRHRHLLTRLAVGVDGQRDDAFTLAEDAPCDGRSIIERERGEGVLVADDLARFEDRGDEVGARESAAGRGDVGTDRFTRVREAVALQAHAGLEDSTAVAEVAWRRRFGQVGVERLELPFSDRLATARDDRRAFLAHRGPHAVVGLAFLLRRALAHLPFDRIDEALQAEAAAERACILDPEHERPALVGSEVTAKAQRHGEGHGTRAFGRFQQFDGRGDRFGRSEADEQFSQISIEHGVA